MGQVITFYSYKGGTGRTMALANIACLLASKTGQRGHVLAVDWDLEAPGLHRFLPGPPNTAEEVPGVIELIEAFGDMVRKEAAYSEELINDALLRFDLWKYMSPTRFSSVRLIKAGRFDGEYVRRVREFNWQDLYAQCPFAFAGLASSFEKLADYTLVDSRTGLCDISGVCTTLLPEKLVLVFTPNRQSVLGGVELVRKAIQHRISSEDARSFIVYPLPSRVELSEAALRRDWRFGAEDLIGYQPLFEDLFREVYALDACDLSPYFDRVQVPHVPRYAYGEEIAVLQERTRDVLSASHAYDELTAWLLSGTPPWEAPPSEADY